MAIDTGRWKRLNHWSWKHEDKGWILRIKPNYGNHYLDLTSGQGSTYGWLKLTRYALNGIFYSVKNYGSGMSLGKVKEFRDIEYMAEKYMREGILEKWMETHPPTESYDDEVTELYRWAKANEGKLLWLLMQELKAQ